MENKKDEKKNEPKSMDEIKSMNGNSYLYLDTALPRYLQFPEFLLNVPVSMTARILYMLLYDRARLSMKNGWTDEKGRVYLTFTIGNLSKETGRSISAVKAGISELLKADLLEKESRGYGKPNCLYVKIPSDFSPCISQKTDHGTGGKQPTDTVGKQSMGTGGKQSPNKVIMNKNEKNKVNNTNKASGSFYPSSGSLSRLSSRYEPYADDEESL